MVDDAGVVPACCGADMLELIPGNVEASGENPKVTFRLNDEKPLAVYAYCNLHGLWETELQ